MKFTIYVDETIDGYRVDLYDSDHIEKLNPENTEEVFKILERIVREKKNEYSVQPK
jgi:hypothetical protein